jgi:hypothetical protein
MVRFAGHIEVPGGGEAAALRALLQEPEWSDQGCYGLGYVDGPLAVSQHGLGMIISLILFISILSSPIIINLLPLSLHYTEITVATARMP